MGVFGVIPIAWHGCTCVPQRGDGFPHHILCPRYKRGVFQSHAGYNETKGDKMDSAEGWAVPKFRYGTKVHDTTTNLKGGVRGVYIDNRGVSYDVANGEGHSAYVPEESLEEME